MSKFISGECSSAWCSNISAQQAKSLTLRNRGLGLIVAGEILLVVGVCLSKLGLGLGIAGFLCYMDGIAVLAEVNVPAHPLPDQCDGLFVRDTMGDGTVMYYPAEPEDIAHFGRGVGYDELHEEAGTKEH